MSQDVLWSNFTLWKSTHINNKKCEHLCRSCIHLSFAGIKNFPMLFYFFLIIIITLMRTNTQLLAFLECLLMLTSRSKCLVDWSVVMEPVFAHCLGEQLLVKLLWHYCVGVRAHMLAYVLCIFEFLRWVAMILSM
jgi:hypothetical protein